MKIPKIGLFISVIILTIFCNYLPGLTQNVNQNSASKLLAQTANSEIIKSGTTVIINNQKYNLPWVQWQANNTLHIAVSDMGSEAILGFELLSTNQPEIQPIHWFPYYKDLPAKFIHPYRYLDLTEFAKITKINVNIDQENLKIDIPNTKVTKAYTTPELVGQKIVIELDRPTFWQFSQGKDQGILKIEGQAIPDLIDKFKPPQPIDNVIEENEGDQVQGSENNQKKKPLFIIENSNNQAIITINTPAGNNLKVSSVNPNLLFIDIKPDAMLEREIRWHSDIFWQQKYIPITQDLPSLKNDLFFVSYLTLNLRKSDLYFRPITTNSNSMIGTSPLTKTAQNLGAIAAINGGFFNRKNQLPLGAIKAKEKWFSGPILNRGVIAWNELGDIKIDRLKLQETLTTSTGDRLIINHLNSGYIQAGISRYTYNWGLTYTTLTDNETVVLVEGDKIKEQLNFKKAGEDSVAIPSIGYLLTIREKDDLASKLELETKVKLESSTIPNEFANYRNILGAGPVLLLNREIVLNGEAEKFSTAFNTQKASRSAIATTNDGKLLLVAVHNRVGGAGPTLLELAKILQNLGAIDALNLDGGSSTQLYLGGQIIDRSPATAARVHNGIGIFLSSDENN